MKKEGENLTSFSMFLRHYFQFTSFILLMFTNDIQRVITLSTILWLCYHSFCSYYDLYSDTFTFTRELSMLLDLPRYVA